MQNAGELLALMRGFEVPLQNCLAVRIVLDVGGQHNPTDQPSSILPFLKIELNLYASSGLMNDSHEVPDYSKHGQGVLNDAVVGVIPADEFRESFLLESLSENGNLTANRPREFGYELLTSNDTLAGSELGAYSSPRVSAV